MNDMTALAATDPDSLRAAGWAAHEPSGFTAQLGLCWIGGTPERRVLGFHAEDRHTNLFGKVHGGAVMTFADICLGYGASEAAQHQSMVTADLHVQFIAGAGAGEFIVGYPEVIRRTRHLIFVRGLIMAGETTIANAQGVWKVLGKH